MRATAIWKVTVLLPLRKTASGSRADDTGKHHNSSPPIVPGRRIGNWIRRGKLAKLGAGVTVDLHAHGDFDDFRFLPGPAHAFSPCCCPAPRYRRRPILGVEPHSTDSLTYCFRTPVSSSSRSFAVLQTFPSWLGPPHPPVCAGSDDSQHPHSQFVIDEGRFIQLDALFRYRIACDEQSWPCAPWGEFT